CLPTTYISTLSLLDALPILAEIGQAVDDRDRAVIREILDFLLRIGADHDAVQIAGQNARGILHRLAAADLQIAVGQEQRLPAELDRKSTRLNSSHVSISYAV